MHNMSASAVIPVDSLRSPSFTQKYGTTTSIMDYARFNYVARPGMGARREAHPRRVSASTTTMPGNGSRPCPTTLRRLPTNMPSLRKWITGAAARSTVFGKQQFSRSIDPPFEDLGDDAVKASGYASPI